MTMRALAADGVDASVLHVSPIKLPDEAILLAQARKSGRLAAAENHTLIGGLEEAEATTLLRNGLTPFLRQIALLDAVLDAGALSALHDHFDISTTEVY